MKNTRYDLLTITSDPYYLDEYGSGAHRRQVVDCVCDCGNTRTIKVQELKKLKIKSCSQWCPIRKQMVSTKETVECPNCQKIFDRCPSRQAKYCSFQCSVEHKKFDIINDFSEITSESSYWLGFIFGDGSVDKKYMNLQVGLSKKDEDHLIKLSEYIYGTDRVYKYDTKSLLRVNNPILVNNLKTKGVTNNKTYSQTIPIPKIFQYDFIRGFIDADGWAGVRTIYNKKYKKEYYNPHIGLCSYLKGSLIEVCEALDFKGKKILKKKNQELYEVRWSSKNDVLDILTKLKIFDQSTIKLNRKWDKLNEYYRV
jgi:hypothetical protein